MHNDSHPLQKKPGSANVYYFGQPITKPEKARPLTVLLKLLFSGAEEPEKENSKKHNTHKMWNK